MLCLLFGDHPFAVRCAKNLKSTGLAQSHVQNSEIGVFGTSRYFSPTSIFACPIHAMGAGIDKQLGGGKL